MKEEMLVLRVDPLLVLEGVVIDKTPVLLDVVVELV